jgi:NCAIR mutase (PurE)-related protein
VSDTLDDLLRASAELRATPRQYADAPRPHAAAPHAYEGEAPADPTPTSRPDFDREHRKGVPEVIYAPGKTVPQALEMARALLERTGRALISRASDELEASVRAAFPHAALEVHTASRMCVLKRPDYRGPSGGGGVGVLTAGTSDIAAAEEAAVVAAEMGCDVVRAYDVGVAGLHRLTEPLRELARRRVDVVIVAAGMDGALPSVVSGLVDVPVIGLPTSVGYGLGGQGVGALLSMLQTCSPGLSVVNIDNGVGAGATAALIANRVAAARRQS